MKRSIRVLLFVLALVVVAGATATVRVYIYRDPQVFVKTCPRCQDCVPVVFEHHGSTYPYDGWYEEGYSCRRNWHYEPFGLDSLLASPEITDAFYWSPSDSSGALIWVRYSDTDTSKIDRQSFRSIFGRGFRYR